MKIEKTEQYSEQESQRRFQKLLRAAINTKPSPLKNKPKTSRGLRASRGAAKTA